MQTPIVSGLYAALSALLMLALAGNVVRLRQRHKVGLGDGGQTALSCAVRAHANASEYLPLALLLLVLYEIGGAPGWAVHAYGGVLLAARIAHGLGLSGSPGGTPGRFYGTLATWLVMLGLATQLVLRLAG